MAESKFTPERVEVFLNEMMAVANITRAAGLAGIGVSTLYKHRAEDPAFAEAWYHAEQIGLDAIEDEVTRRGVEGTLKPVFYKGEVCGEIREYSDTLLMFKLNGRRPDVFKYRPAIGGTQGGDGGEQTVVKINIGFANGGPGNPRPITAQISDQREKELVSCERAASDRNESEDVNNRS